ncbi:hypothetical protein [Rhodococcoides yunnanense]|uniref:Condensation domain-containing protein n=1 Tax=Rhodococcoides yunnanense TaxID=278209 RepID=A0ABU4B7A7_9NOCA|nr:hypothetical protein [Rhodococcus yunnanensis]MDV6260068.1 hypothetical protein [Rhodococcus yunnanensis]
MINSRYIGVAGPARRLTEDAVRSTLQSLADSGTHTRIGLVPKHGTVSWDVSESLGADAVRVVKPSSTSGHLESVIADVRRRDGERLPLEVTICGEYLFIDTAHGLSDGKLFVDLVEALHLNDIHGASVWSLGPESSHVIPKTMLRWFALHPLRLRDAWRALKGMQALKQQALAEVAQVEDSDMVPWSPSPTVVIRQSNAANEAAVSAWRKENAPSAGAATVALWLVRCAMERVGLQSTPVVTIAINCRRYLNANTTVNGNFAVGLDVAVSGTRPIEPQARVLDAVYTSGLPLAVLGLVSASVRVKPATDRTAVDQVLRNPKVKLMYSDLGRPPSWARVPWTEGEGGQFAGLLDPSAPDAITVMGGVVGKERTYSVSFHDNVFERAKIEQAMDLIVTDPLLLLESVSSDLVEQHERV